MYACGSLVFGGKGGGVNSSFSSFWAAFNAQNFYWAKKISVYTKVAWPISI